MRITKLPKEAVDALEQAYKREKDGRTKRRYHALWLLARRFDRAQVASIVGISKDRIRQWVTMYHKAGLVGLHTKPAPGNHRLLTNQQKQIIKELITTNTPDHLSLTGKFWNIPLLRQLVKQQFDLLYKDDDSYRRLLHFCGFSFHKPKKVNKRQSPYERVRFEETLKKDSETGRIEKIRWSW